MLDDDDDGMVRKEKEKIYTNRQEETLREGQQ